jgi:hypothetical protein
MNGIRLSTQTPIGEETRAILGIAAPKTFPPPVEQQEPIQKNHGKRTTSARLERLDDLRRVIRDYGFSDQSHFFQLCTDALLRAHAEGCRLDWPPNFNVRPPMTHSELHARTKNGTAAEALS